MCSFLCVFLFRAGAMTLYGAGIFTVRESGVFFRLRLVTSRGPPYPSRSPRAHPSGWTRTQGLSHRDSHAPPSSGRPPSGCGTGRWLLFYNGAENQAGQGSESYYHCAVPNVWSRRPAPTRPDGTQFQRHWNGTKWVQWMPRQNGGRWELHGRPVVGSAGVSMLQPPTRPGRLRLHG